MASGTVIFYCSRDDVNDDGDNNEHNVITNTGNLRYTMSSSQLHRLYELSAGQRNLRISGRPNWSRTRIINFRWRVSLVRLFQHVYKPFLFLSRFLRFLTFFWGGGVFHLWQTHCSMTVAYIIVTPSFIDEADIRPTLTSSIHSLCRDPSSDRINHSLQLNCVLTDTPSWTVSHQHCNSATKRPAVSLSVTAPQIRFTILALYTFLSTNVYCKRCISYSSS